MWRATDSNGVVCGDSSGAASAYPYSYFYQPLSGTSYRFCVDSCPAYSGGIITPPNVYNAPVGLSWTSLNSDGTLTAPAPYPYLLYDSSSMISRICIPSTAVFNNAFNTILSTFYSSVNIGAFGNFITDLSNVSYFI
jgi:hypothetical protein